MCVAVSPQDPVSLARPFAASARARRPSLGSVTRLGVQTCATAKCLHWGFCLCLCVCVGLPIASKLKLPGPAPVSGLLKEGALPPRRAAPRPHVSRPPLSSTARCHGMAVDSAEQDEQLWPPWGPWR